MKWCINLFILLLMASCGTVPVSDREATSVPADRHLKYNKSKPGTVPVSIKRDKGMAAVVCAAKIYVDGNVAARIKAGEKIILYIPPGEVILGATLDGICSSGFVEIEANLKVGKPAFYRIGFDQNASIGIYKTSPR